MWGVDLDRNIEFRKASDGWKNKTSADLHKTFVDF
jgi:hypothetical protein